MALIGRQKFDAVIVAVFDLDLSISQRVNLSERTIVLTTLETSDSSPTRTTISTLGGAKVFHLSVAVSHAEVLEGPNIVVFLDKILPRSCWIVLTDKLRREMGRV